MRSIVGVSLLLCASGGGGCTNDDGPAFYVTGLVSPAGTTCTVSAGSAILALGQLNVQFADSYYMFPRYRNQVISNAGTSPLRSDPAGIYVLGAEIELQNAAGGRLLFGRNLPNPYTVPAADFVPPAGGVGGSTTEVGVVQAIPPDYMPELDALLARRDRGAMLISLNVFGETVGGTDIEAREFLWPLQLCRGGCLFTCSDTTTGTCCLAGQDQLCEIPSDDPACTP